ncbi:MAG: hypothetical protein EZS28_012460 [Streblomastix strix]|uniref:Major facilitator superfamily (MFS) profile domain-containing protein n=1 Tax=Streblomastix strix TaxID=222440 RepID=A0A5J4WCB2_9EUKA|nr:MAG: hypothetical protein EZS28_012460 [Streblomastix strix]
MSSRKELKSDVWALFVSLFGGVCFGMGAGIIAGILGEPRFLELSSGQSGLFSASLVYGIAFGSILPAFLADIIGRKLIFIIAGFESFIFHIILAFMNSTAACIVMRTFAGIGIGAITTLAPSYTAELASDKRRSILLGIYQVNITIGIALGYLFNIPFNYVSDGWRFKFELI